ncbi:PMEI, partial [Musa troglodytarum]
QDAANSSPNIKYDFCVAELRPYPGSGSADQKSLTVIAASLTKDKATSTSAKVKNLLASTSDPKTKQCLESCESVYEDLLSDLENGHPGHQGGSPGRRQDLSQRRCGRARHLRRRFQGSEGPRP